MTEHNPLVSIIVITFNSAKYVLETLESARSQTYQNLELIVSDDCSTDNTVEICRKWIDENKARFVRTELVTVKKNTGIPANFNRGLRLANGYWLKPIAGDDVLIDDAVNNIITYSKTKVIKDILLTLIDVYNENFQISNFITTRPNEWKNIAAYYPDPNSNNQIEHILKGGYHNSPGIFYKKKLIEEIGYYDERYNLIEDVPLFLKIALQGKVIEFVPIKTVKYRKTVNNMTSTKGIIVPKYSMQLYDAIYSASKEYGMRRFIINSLWNKILLKVIFLRGNNGFICQFINFIRVKLQPILFYYILDKLIKKIKLCPS